ncbi:MAG: putative transposase [Bradymonadia bacterium]|jgi:putative transposase
MTPPRQITPASLFEVDIRAMSRQFRFPPSARMNQLLRYLCAVAAEKYGIAIYAFVVMGNHFHLIGFDADGLLPDFMCYLNGLIARSVNSMQARKDKLWSGEGYNLLRPQTNEDLWARIEYVLSNPLAADLVETLNDYPGVASRARDYGVDIVIKRPDWFFGPKSVMPAEATLRFVVPPQLGLTDAEFRSELVCRMERNEAYHRRRRRDAGRAVLGLKRLRQMRVGDVPKSRERWFQLRPAIAAKNKQIRMAAIQALKAFRDGYRAALQRWRSGELDAEFPSGTWWMVRFAGALAVPS